MSDYITLREAALEMGVHYDTLLAWIRLGKFPLPLVRLPEHERMGKPRRYYRVERALVEEWKRGR